MRPMEVEVQQGAICKSSGQQGGGLAGTSAYLLPSYLQTTFSQFESHIFINDSINLEILVLPMILV